MKTFRYKSNNEDYMNKNFIYSELSEMAIEKLNSDIWRYDNVREQTYW